MLDPRIVYLGVLLNILGTGGYVRDTLRGTTRPNRATFLLWAVAPLIAFAAEVGEGVGLNAVTTLSAGIAPLLILVASFVNSDAYWRLTTFDYACGALSLGALVAWRLSGHGGVAVLLSIVADLIAALPTIVKAHRFPETETGWTYMLAGLAGLTGVLAATSLSLEAVAFPAYLVLLCGGLATLTVGRGPAPARAECGEVR